MNQTNATYTKTSKVAAFFNAYWDAYVKNPTRPVKAEHFKAVNAMRACRTAILGIVTTIFEKRKDKKIQKKKRPELAKKCSQRGI